MEVCITRYASLDAAPQATKGDLAQTLSAPGTLNLPKIGFTLLHTESVVRSLCEAVPKGYSEGFCYFWHPVG